MDSNSQALSILFSEHLVVAHLLGNFQKHFEALLHDHFLDDTRELVPLKSLPR